MRSLLAVAVLIAFAGCRSTGGPQPQAPSAPLPDALQAWVGQQRFIASAGEAKSLAVKAGESLTGGNCDVAVVVRSASFERGAVSVALDTLGRAEVEARMRGRECREVPSGRRLTISGLATAEDAPAALERVLLTPEALLAARDVPFELPADKAPPKLAAVPPESEGTGDERILGRQVTVWPKALLSVHPTVAGGVPHEGEIDFVVTVGPDGRVYKPRLVTSLGQAQEQRVLEILALWRYEPAKKREERVAARVQGRATLRIR